jgi:hypothetical protein
MDINKEKSELIDLVKSSITEIASKEAQGAAKNEVVELQKGLEDKIAKSLEGVVSKEEMDKMENEFKKQLKGYEDRVKKEISFDAALSDAIIKSMDSLKAFQKGEISKTGIEIQKDPAVLTAGTSLGATSAANAFAVNNNQLIVPLARRQRHVREVIGMSATDEAVFPYLRETATEGAVNVQNPEGSAKAQIEYKSELVFATESTIAAFQLIGRQTLSNVRGLSSFIQLHMVKDLLLKEDQQLLFGTGSNGQVAGFFGSGAQGMTGFNIATLGPNIYDLIAACASKLAALDYTANFAMINPVDYWKMVITKDKDEAYVNNVVFDSAASLLYVFGIPVVASTAIAAGNVGVGDSNYVMPMQREGISLRFSEEDSDNFQKNLITARVEERILQAILRPNAFVYGSIATGLAAITQTS